MHFLTVLKNPDKNEHRILIWQSWKWNIHAKAIQKAFHCCLVNCNKLVFAYYTSLEKGMITL